MNNQGKHSKFSVRERLLTVIRVLEEGWRVTAAALAIGCSRQIVYRWIRRFQEFGQAGLEDRSSRPRSCPWRLDALVCLAIQRLRHDGHPLRVIAEKVQLLPCTVWRQLKRWELNRRQRPEREAVRRYEADKPGELVHMDTKKLRSFAWAGRKFINDGGRRQRGAGRQYLHVMIDSHSRVAFAQILPRENAQTCLAFIDAAKEFFASLGVKIQRVLTDNGSAYRSKKLAKELPAGMKHSFTRVRRPQTNGKAERFIRTAMEEWGYRRYENSSLRDLALPQWLKYYNEERSHSGIGHKAPISRL